MFADYHLHTNFSPDSSQDMEGMVKNAIKNRICEICFTDHIDFDSTDKSYIYEFDLDEYFSKIKYLKDKYSDNICIKIGVEMGLQPHILKKCDEFINLKSFDFVIASMHCCNKKDFYLGDFFRDITPVEGIKKYYKELSLILDSYDNYNVLGHLDIYKRYEPKCMDVSFKEYDRLLEEVFKKVIKKDRGIEINTSGLREPSSGRRYLNESLPSSKILELYYEMGGKILTLGSDSHDFTSLCSSFPQVLSTLNRIGFKDVFIFNKMVPEPIKISNLL